MFKILELADGSTKVYDSETGRVICSVPKKRDKPLAVISPNCDNTSNKVKKMKNESKYRKAKGIGRPIRRQVNLNQQTSVNDTSHLLTCIPKCAVMPLQWESPFSQKLVADHCSFRAEKDLLLDQEVSEDCISQLDFLQTLNLCPVKVAKNEEELRLLKQKLPTRRISQIPVKPSESKICEEIPLTSILGRKLFNKDLKNNPQKTLNETAMDYSVKKYENFCGTSKDSNLPYIMRNREFKDYTNTIHKPPKPVSSTHTYSFSFSKKARRERNRVLETGLNKKGRHLYRKCIKMSVTLKRLSPKIIKQYTEKKPKPSKDIILIDLEPSPPSKSKKSSPRCFAKCDIINPTIKPCKVLLKDIAKDFEFTKNGVFVRGTTIKVDVPNHMKVFHTYAKQLPIPISSQHQEHAYFMTIERPKSVKVPTPHLPKFIPLIDIASSDEDEGKEEPPQSTEATSFIQPELARSLFLSPIVGDKNRPQIVGVFTFRCFCHPCKFTNTCTVHDQAASIIQQHMKIVHKSNKWCIAVRKHNASNIYIIEAFWNEYGSSL